MPDTLGLSETKELLGQEHAVLCSDDKGVTWVEVGHMRSMKPTRQRSEVDASSNFDVEDYRSRRSRRKNAAACECNFIPDDPGQILVEANNDHSDQDLYFKVLTQKEPGAVKYTMVAGVLNYDGPNMDDDQIQRIQFTLSIQGRMVKGIVDAGDLAPLGL